MAAPSTADKTEPAKLIDQLDVCTLITDNDNNGAARIETTLKALLDLSSAPPDQVTLLRRGILSEYISQLERETSPSELNQLLDLILHRILSVPSGTGSDVARATALEILRNLSRSKRMKQTLFHAQGLVAMLTEVARNGTGKAFVEKELAIQIVNNLGCDTQIAVNLCQISMLVDELMVCAQSGETPLVREWAVRSINNMAFAEENQRSLFARPGLITMLISSAMEGETDGIREWCIAALDNLCVPDLHKVAACLLPDFVDSLVSAATCEGAQESRWALRKTGMKALNNLGALSQAAPILFVELQRNDQLERLLRAHRFSVRDDGTFPVTDQVMGFREAFQGLMLGLSCPPSNHQDMFNKAGLVDILVSRILVGSAIEQEHCLGTLMNLAVTGVLRQPLYKREHLVETVVRAIEAPRSVRVREHGVGLLGNLALDMMNARMLVKQSRVLFVLVEGVLQFTGPRVSPELELDDEEELVLHEDPSHGSRVLCDWSRQLLWTLGYRHADFPAVVQQILVLASAYDIPRLSRASLFRRMIPKEMVREIAVRLLPLHTGI